MGAVLRTAHGTVSSRGVREGVGTERHDVLKELGDARDVGLQFLDDVGHDLAQVGVVDNTPHRAPEHKSHGTIHLAKRCGDAVGGDNAPGLSGACCHGEGRGCPLVK